LSSKIDKNEKEYRDISYAHIISYLRKKKKKQGKKKKSKKKKKHVENTEREREREINLIDLINAYVL